jgi:type II secretory pathway pseudopilin PulG
VTLLELLVVLVLLGLAAAAVAPAVRGPVTEPADPRERTIAAARALAVRRAEALRLEIDAAGRWRLLARDSVLRTGALPAAGAPLRLAISPLGVCVPERDDNDAPPATGSAADAVWDVAACAPTTRAGAGA